jgi:flagellar protein FlaG
MVSITSTSTSTSAVAIGAAGARPRAAANPPVPTSAAPTAGGAVEAGGATESLEQRARQAVGEANRLLAENDRQLTFEFDDSVERIVFRLIDTSTKEVLRQIPSEEVLAIARALSGNGKAGGALLNTDA